MTDVLGQAIFDFYYHLPAGKLWIYNKYGPKEEMPVNVYFRGEEEMPELELFALEKCKGKVLDIGAGAGSHSLLLQERKVDVTALELSPKAAVVMELRGVEKIIKQDIYKYQTERFDTLLLLMNGIGLTGNIEGLRMFLQHAKKLIKPGGQLLFDSSDVAYVYEGKLPGNEKYYGEILYRYQYKKLKTDWFSWLYIDEKKLSAIAAEEGWQAEVLLKDEFDQYLVRLVEL